MKKIMLFVMITMFIITGIILTARAGKPSEPRLEVDHSEWNFGKIKEGEKVSHVFKIKNTGNATLIIDRLIPSCKCTSAVFSSSSPPPRPRYRGNRVNKVNKVNKVKVNISPKSIKPGKSSKVKVTFDSKGRRGLVTHYVRIKSNDPKRERKVFYIGSSAFQVGDLDPF